MKCPNCITPMSQLTGGEFECESCGYNSRDDG